MGVPFGEPVPAVALLVRHLTVYARFSRVDHPRRPRVPPRRARVPAAMVVQAEPAAASAARRSSAVEIRQLRHHRPVIPPAPLNLHIRVADYKRRVSALRRWLPPHARRSVRMTFHSLAARRLMELSMRQTLRPEEQLMLRQCSTRLMVPQRQPQTRRFSQRSRAHKCSYDFLTKKALPAWAISSLPSDRFRTPTGR